MKTLITGLLIALSLAGQPAKNVTEFTIFKRAEPLGIAPDVSVVLKGTDIKKQRFKIELIVDGHTIELKDLNIKIPVTFYVGTNTEAHEFVVTKVAQDQIAGRLSSPIESVPSTSR